MMPLFSNLRSIVCTVTEAGNWARDDLCRHSRARKSVQGARCFFHKPIWGAIVVGLLGILVKPAQAVEIESCLHFEAFPLGKETRGTIEKNRNEAFYLKKGAVPNSVPLANNVAFAISTEYVGAHMSKMPLVRSEYKPYEKREPARASSFLVYLLLERIWMTEYHGHPIDRQAGFHETCIDQIEQSINQKEGPIALGTVRGPSDIPFDPPESAKSKRVWEFRCSPIKILSAPKFGGHAVEHLEYQMLAFNGVERVVPALVEILKTGKLGRYRISRAEAERMVFDLVDVFPTLKQSLFPKTISLLANYPFLDGDAWDDTPETDLIPESGAGQEFLEKKRRLSNTGILYGDYNVIEDGIYATVSIPIYNGFY